MMNQNLVWATAYILVAIPIPIAMGVLSRWGIDLPMAVGALAMSLSTVIVAANAPAAAEGARAPGRARQDVPGIAPSWRIIPS